MQSQTPVELADRVSRGRAFVMVVVAAIFVVVQVIGRPFFRQGPDASDVQANFWALNVVVLLLFLATGGGLLRNRQLRTLLNDEVSNGNRAAGIVAGYWVAMATAMLLYIVPAVRDLTMRQTIYLVVSPSVVVALLAFAFLEYRAHRDA
jgi:hypothetical protein